MQRATRLYQERATAREAHGASHCLAQYDRGRVHRGDVALARRKNANRVVCGGTLAIVELGGAERATIGAAIHERQVVRP